MESREKELDLLEKLERFPAPLRERFLDRIQGAADALEAVKAAPGPASESRPGA